MDRNPFTLRRNPLRPSRRWPVVAVTTAVLALAACSGGGSTTTADSGGTSGGSSGSSTGGSFTTPGTAAPGVATTLPTKSSSFKVRFFNDITVDGKPVGAIDLYDDLIASTTATSLPKGDKPIVKGLKYGEFSDYVVPRQFVQQGSNGETEFTAQISGEKPGPSNPLVSAGGVSKGTSPPQQTLVLTSNEESSFSSDSGQSASDADGSSKGLPNLSSTGLAEKKGGQQDAPPSTAPSEKAVFALDTSNIPKADDGGGTFFFVDQSCDPPANSDYPDDEVPDIFVSGASSDKLGPYPFFETTAGTHDLALTFWADNTKATCDQVKPKSAQGKATVEAGKVYLTIPYGVDADHLKIATAAIAE